MWWEKKKRGWTNWDLNRGHWMSWWRNNHWCLEFWKAWVQIPANISVVGSLVFFLSPFRQILKQHSLHRPRPLPSTTSQIHDAIIVLSFVLYYIIDLNVVIKIKNESMKIYRPAYLKSLKLLRYQIPYYLLTRNCYNTFTKFYTHDIPSATYNVSVIVGHNNV
jgi:hypothetical protein